MEQNRRSLSYTSRCPHPFTPFEAIYAANHVLHVKQGAVSQQNRETSGRRSCSTSRPKQRHPVHNGSSAWTTH